MLEEDNYSAALILERIRERGCQCGYTIVKDCVFSFASSAAYTPCCVFFEEKTDIHARLLHGYFLVSFLNYRFYEFNYGKGIILKMAYQCKSESFQSPVIHNLDNYTKNWKMSSVF